MKDNKKCGVCGFECDRVAKHIASAHPKEFERQNQLVIKYYREGLSARKIAELPDVMYTGGTSVVRVLNKYLTKEELEVGRKERISATIQTAVDTGEREWIHAINTERNKSEEGRKKNSEGLKRAYSDGTKKICTTGINLSKTEKDVNYEKVSQTMQEKADNGELTTLLKSGPEHPKWLSDRSQVSKSWRKNEEFQKNDRLNILKRADYKCQKCGITAEQLAIRAAEGNLNRCMLECDHIVPIHKHGIRDWENNGQALCSFCHISKTLVEMKEMEAMPDEEFAQLDL